MSGLEALGAAASVLGGLKTCIDLLDIVTVLVAAPHMTCIHLQATFICRLPFNCESHS